MSHVTLTNESRRTYELVMAQMRMSHVTHMIGDTHRSKHFALT